MEYLAYLIVEDTTGCHGSEVDALHLGQEEKGGTVAIWRKLRDIHFWVLSDMLISKIDDGLYRSLVNYDFSGLKVRTSRREKCQKRQDI